MPDFPGLGTFGGRWYHTCDWPVAGVDFVGTIPAEIQKVNVYAAAVVAGSKELDASRRLIAFLASDGAIAAIKKSGMEPSRPR